MDDHDQNPNGPGAHAEPGGQPGAAAGEKPPGRSLRLPDDLKAVMAAATGGAPKPETPQRPSLRPASTIEQNPTNALKDTARLSEMSRKMGLQAAGEGVRLETVFGGAPQQGGGGRVEPPSGNAPAAPSGRSRYPVGRRGKGSHKARGFGNICARVTAEVHADVRNFAETRNMGIRELVLRALQSYGVPIPDDIIVAPDDENYR